MVESPAPPRPEDGEDDTRARALRSSSCKEPYVYKAKPKDEEPPDDPFAAELARGELEASK